VQEERSPFQVGVPVNHDVDSCGRGLFRSYCKEESFTVLVAPQKRNIASLAPAFVRQNRNIASLAPAFVAPAFVRPKECGQATTENQERLDAGSADVLVRMSERSSLRLRRKIS